MRSDPGRRPRRLWAALMATALLGGSYGTATATDPQRPDPSSLHPATTRPVQAGGTLVGDFTKAARRDGKVAIVVKLDNDFVAAYTGGVSGFPATNPKTRGARTIDLKGTDTARYRSFLKGKQDAFTGALATKIKGSKVNAHYDLILNAVAVTVPDDKITAVAKLPGVAAVYPDTVEQVQTDTSPAFIGAPTVWGNLGGQESSGEGVIVGVLDTGIWPEHPSFADPDPSGKRYAPPPAAPDGSRACQFGSTTPGDVPFTCNNKLIGAYRFMDVYDAFGPDLLPGENRSARDDDGHGTHTSSTAAGDAGVQASIFGIPRGTISGIAPRAYIEMFKVCGDSGCFGVRLRRGRRRLPSATASTSSTSRSAAARARTRTSASSPSSMPTTRVCSWRPRPATTAPPPIPPSTALRGSPRSVPAPRRAPSSTPSTSPPTAERRWTWRASR